MNLAKQSHGFSHKKLIYILALGLIFTSCSGEKKVKESKVPEKSFLKTEITEFDDSLAKLYKMVMEDPNFKFPETAINQGIHRNLEFYKYYPNDPYAATCLDKAQQLFMQDKAYGMALKYTDTILLKYPNYEKKADLLLNAGSTGEIMQDTAVVRKYYTKLLKECPKLNKDTKEMVEFRLAHLNLTFDQLIDLQIQKMSQK